MISVLLLGKEPLEEVDSFVSLGNFFGGRGVGIFFVVLLFFVYNVIENVDGATLQTPVPYDSAGEENVENGFLSSYQQIV